MDETTFFNFSLSDIYENFDIVLSETRNKSMANFGRKFTFLLLEIRSQYIKKKLIVLCLLYLRIINLLQVPDIKMINLPSKQESLVVYPVKPYRTPPSSNKQSSATQKCCGVILFLFLYIFFYNIYIFFNCKISYFVSLNTASTDTGCC